jgi:hypothetical protein
MKYLQAYSGFPSSTPMRQSKSLGMYSCAMARSLSARISSKLLGLQFLRGLRLHHAAAEGAVGQLQHHGQTEDVCHLVAVLAVDDHGAGEGTSCGIHRSAR